MPLTPLRKSIRTFFVTSGGAPAEKPPVLGFLTGINENQVQFESDPHSIPPVGRMLLGVEGENGQQYFAFVEVQETRSAADVTQVEATFVDPSRDIFREENLKPRFDPACCRYSSRLSDTVRERWVSLGVLQPALSQRVLACPKCHAAATFRSGCRSCGSIHTASSQMIHHFACAYVGPTSEFETSEGLVCPKCRLRHLVVGSDFELLDGPYHCLDCDWSDSELAMIGQCLACELRFPLEMAPEDDVIDFHVNRLDPMALIGGSA